jgi:hypothetical protein
MWVLEKAQVITGRCYLRPHSTIRNYKLAFLLDVVPNILSKNTSPLGCLALNILKIGPAYFVVGRV